jgi:hypothetical protein
VEAAGAEVVFRIMSDQPLEECDKALAILREEQSNCETMPCKSAAECAAMVSPFVEKLPAVDDKLMTLKNKEKEDENLLKLMSAMLVKELYSVMGPDLKVQVMDTMLAGSTDIQKIWSAALISIFTKLLSEDQYISYIKPIISELELL